MTPEQITEALRLYIETDEPTAEIAARFGVGAEHFMNVLRGRPGYAAAARRRSAHKSPYFPMRDEELIALFRQGLSGKAIAVRVGIGVAVVRRRIAALGIRDQSPPAIQVAIPRGTPGVALPPFPLTWEDIVDLAWRERLEINNRDDLVRWNRVRVRRGDAPLCIRAKAVAA